MYGKIKAELQETLNEIKNAGLYKNERIIQSPQSAEIIVDNKKVLNFCANNYLGLADNPRLIEAAKKALDEYGYGLSSVRFICGTQRIHKDFEAELASFLGYEDAILYASCFDANGGLFEPLLGEQDAIVSDSLNHASIIDGIRLCKAKRFRYEHADLNDLEKCLKEARTQGAKRIMVVTDSVFSMDGEIADLPSICNIAEKYEALVMIDECHATGFLGEKGRGVSEMLGVEKRIDITNSTLGKALGGAVGGFTVSHQEVISLLRQRSRPYLFSNSLPPAIIAASSECLKILSESSALRKTLAENTSYFRTEMTKLGFELKGKVHPISPVMLGDAQLAGKMAEELLKLGIYVIGFSFPVVPKGQARIRVQISAVHSQEQISRTIEAFHKVGKMLGVI